MFPNINPTHTAGWQALQQHFEEMKNVPMKELFQKDPNRFNKFSIRTEDILFDYSKNIITERTMQLLLQLANECQLPAAIKAMFEGEKINATEKKGRYA